MSDIAIRVEGLGKSYQIRHQRSSYRTLRDDLVNLLPGRRQSGESKETFWALRDINFEVKTGEVLGVIGRNGAGKSTLLKILARITKPSTGYADIFGRVGSLLEVGTGFHPELTGRENIFLSGTILGMRRHEIQRKFDEIVNFAEVEQFLDTPVKRFSSGMYTRLAFAVAAHLDPEILIVDEVLAVGDTAFQKKSLGKMGEVAESGRTVLFVSHNMAAVSRLCNSALLLERSRTVAHGNVQEVTSLYQKSDMQTTAAREWNIEDHISSSSSIIPIGIYLKSDTGEVLEAYKVSDNVNVEIIYEVRVSNQPIVPTIRLINSDGIIVFTSFDTQSASYSLSRKPGRYQTRIQLPKFLLNEGFYTILLSINVGIPMVSHFYEPDAVGFHIVEDADNNIVRSHFGSTIPGVIRPHLTWNTVGPL